MRIPALGPIALVLLLIAAPGRSQSDAQSSSPPKDGAKAAPAAIKPLPITVAKAEAREVQRSVETVGSLLAWDDAQVRTELPGTIARLLADLGDSVTRGQVLAEYDAREFDLAVKQAEADLLSTQQSLARGRATVGASEAALRRAKDGLVSLEAEVRRTESEVEWAKSELERNGTLFRGGLIAARDVDNARNLHNVAVSRMAVAISARDQHPDQMRMAEAQVDSDRASDAPDPPGDLLDVRRHAGAQGLLVAGIPALEVGPRRLPPRLGPANEPHATFYRRAVAEGLRSIFDASFCDSIQASQA